MVHHANISALILTAPFLLFSANEALIWAETEGCKNLHALPKHQQRFLTRCTMARTPSPPSHANFQAVTSWKSGRADAGWKEWKPQKNALGTSLRSPPKANINPGGVSAGTALRAAGVEEELAPL